MVERNDLTVLEWEWLLKVSRGQTAFLTGEMANHLQSLGVVEPALGSSVVSTLGKELIAKAVAPAVKARKDAEARARNTHKARAERERQRLMKKRRGR